MTDARKTSCYRTPDELASSAVDLKGVLVIGSCLIAGMPQTIKHTHPGCKVDYILFNNALELPKEPPSPLADYDFQVLQIALRSVLPDGAYFRLRYDDAAAFARLLEDSKDRLRVLLDAILKYARESALLTFVGNFLVPQANPFGRMLPRYELSNPAFFIETLNRFLDSEVRKQRNCHPFDADQIAATFGKKYLQDDAVWQINHASVLSDADFEQDRRRLEKVAPASEVYETRVWEFVLATWQEILGMYRIAQRVDAVKLVIVDLDDTLWRGVLAEDGPGSVEGWPLGLAEALLYLKRRGIVLAIASKNDRNFIASNFNKVFGANRLRLDDFAVKEIHWGSKADSVEAILAKMNVLPAGAVFIDDNPAERAAVLAAFPGIRVLGRDLYELRRILLWAPETQSAAVTAESARRTEMIAAQVERESSRKNVSRAAFLRSLKISAGAVNIRSVSHPKFARVMELVNKSNQFNTTGRRWTHQDWVGAFAAGMTVLALEVEDKFTDYGLVVAAVIDANLIVQFVMSCRVVGLGVEETAIAKINQQVIQAGAKEIRGLFTATELNHLCRDLFQKTGFKQVGDVWLRPAKPRAKIPRHVRERESPPDGAPL